MAAVWAGRIGDLTLGDPLAIDEARAAIAALQSDFSEELAAEDARLVAPEADLKSAKEALASAEEALAGAIRTESQMNGKLATGSRGDRCGTDGCGGECGECDWDEACYELYCVCLPNCRNRDCGGDGCGGVCGTGGCGSGNVCTEDGQCQQVATETVCRANCRSLPGGPREVSVRTRDHSARTSRKWAPQKLASLDDTQAYLAVLKSRKGNLDGLILSSDTLTQELEELRSKQDSTKSATTTTTKQLKDEKKALSLATRALKKLPEEERPAAQENINQQTEKVATLAAQLLSLKSDSKELAARGKALQATIKKTAKSLPDIADGSLRLGAEVIRIQEAVVSWQSLKDQVVAHNKVVADAHSIVSSAEKRLSETAELVTAAKEILRETYRPLLETAEEHLAGLLQPAFSAVLIGKATPNGMNHESRYILTLRDKGRLGRIHDAVTALRQDRVDAWDALPEETREAYPNWTKQNHWLDDYLQILESLDQSTTRSTAIESRLLEERTRILEAIKPEAPAQK